MAPLLMFNEPLHILKSRAQRHWWLMIPALICEFGLHLIEHRFYGWANDVLDHTGWLKSAGLYVLRNPSLIAVGLPLLIFILLCIYDYVQQHGYGGLSGKRCISYTRPATDEPVVGTGDFAFSLHFSRHSNATVYLYKRPSVVGLAHIKGARAGTTIRFQSNEDVDSCEIALNEHAILKNSKDFFMQIRIIDVRWSRDEVCFAYEIDRKGRSEFTAL